MSSGQSGKEEEGGNDVVKKKKDDPWFPVHNTLFQSTFLQTLSIRDTLDNSTKERLAAQIFESFSMRQTILTEFKT